MAQIKICIAIIALGIFSLIVNFKKYRRIKKDFICARAKKYLRAETDTLEKVKNELHLLSIKENLSLSFREVILSITVTASEVIGMLIYI